MKGQDSFNGLLLRYRGLLFAVCRRYSRGGLPADDLLQQVALALWERRDKLISITSPPKRAAWIWRVARSAAVDLHRRTPTPTLIPTDYDIEAENYQLHNHLHELIDLLPEPDHTIITLHLEGYDYKEIGSLTNMNKNTVGVRIIRIKEKLKKQWNTV